MLYSFLKRLVYYDADGSGQRIKMNFASISSALESIFKGTAKAKHSENAVERAMKVSEGMCVDGLLFSNHRFPLST